MQSQTKNLPVDSGKNGAEDHGKISKKRVEPMTGKNRLCVSEVIRKQP